MSGATEKYGRSTGNPALDDLEPYAVPAHEAPTDLDLAANYGPAPPARWLSANALRASVVGPYPDARPLERRLAERLGVARERVVVTAGADDALDRAMRLLRPGGEVAVTVPGFEMIRRYARIAGLRLRDVPWTTRRFPIDAILAAVDADTAAVVVVSPDNPSGRVARPSDVRRIRERAPRALLVVDQVYADYGGPELAPETLACDRAILVRSLSKSHGLAGARVGYAVTSARLAERLRAVGQPYAVAGPSLAVAANAIEDDEPVRGHVAAVRRARVEIRRVLRDLGVRSFASRANFVYSDDPRAPWMRDALAGLGIATRGIGSACRVTCPTEPGALERLTGALSSACVPDVLLLDLDGVVADVSRSYRAAIVRTAATFGATVDDDAIRAAKAHGNANDDWSVTHDLVARAGVDVPFENVVERFEALYHGAPGAAEPADGGATPLSAYESLLPSRDTLDRLAAFAPLAIVTGRPRRDTDTFLDRFGLRDRFSAVVTRDDVTELKPDPAPLLEAMRRVGARRAWMVGDTPDDVRAARAASVVPLGVVPPGGDAKEREALAGAGAARVLENLDALVALTAVVRGEEVTR